MAPNPSPPPVRDPLPDDPGPAPQTASTAEPKAPCGYLRYLRARYTDAEIAWMLSAVAWAETAPEQRDGFVWSA